MLIDKFDRLQEVHEDELQPIFDHLLKQEVNRQKERQVSEERGGWNKAADDSVCNLVQSGSH